MKATQKDITVEPFRGDYEALQAMAHSSWRDEYGKDSFPDFYRPAFLRFLFERISDWRYLVAAYLGDEIVGFLANLPQKFHFQGRMCRAVYSCLMVTRKEWLRRGLATRMIREALRLNAEARIDFALFTLETGHRSSRLIEKLEAEGHPVIHIKTIPVLARLLDLPKITRSENLRGWERGLVRITGVHRPPAPGTAPEVRAYSRSDLDSCLDLLDGHRERADLALVWSREDLAAELACPDVSKTLVWERDGRVTGLINFLTHLHIGRTEELWAWINHVAFHRLSPSERTRFVRSFLNHARGLGCAGVVEWKRGYYPTAPLYRNRFFPYFRKVRLVAWNFTPGLDLADLKSVYEIQV